MPPRGKGGDLCDGRFKASSFSSQRVQIKSLGIFVQPAHIDTACCFYICLYLLYHFCALAFHFILEGCRRTLISCVALTLCHYDVQTSTPNDQQDKKIFLLKGTKHIRAPCFPFSWKTSQPLRGCLLPPKDIARLVSEHSPTASHSAGIPTNSWSQSSEAKNSAAGAVMPPAGL